MKLYRGYISSLDNLIEKGIFTADIDSINIVYEDNYWIHVDEYYLVEKYYSTKHIERGLLDKELTLIDSIVLYSLDKQKCVDFVNKKVDKMKEKVARLNDTISSLQITTCDD